MSIDVERLEFLPLFPTETEATVRSRWEAWANEGLTVDDVDEWTDVLPPGIWYVCTSGGVREAARIYDLMGTELAASAHPLWSWGEYLDDHAEGIALERLAATQAEGEVTFFGAVGAVVNAGIHVGVEGVADEVAAKEYEVLAGGQIAADLGAPANLTAVDSAGGTLADATTHRYVVTAINAEGETLPSAEASDATANPNRSITLNWDDKPGATGYRVYRKVGAAGPPYDFLIEVAASAYVDDGDPGVDATRHPPAADTTGEKLTLPVQAIAAGSEANSPAGTVEAILGTTAATSVTNVEAILGGTDPETDESLRERLLARYEGRGPGNKRDYAAWARAFGGVGRVTVVPLWNGPGTVQVIVLDPDGNPVAPSVVAGLQAFLDPVAGMSEGEAPPGAVVTVATAAEVLLDAGATVELDAGYSLDGGTNTIAVRSAIREAVRSYVESIEPGQEVVRQKVIGRIVSVVGVHDVANVTLNGAALNVALDNDPAQVATLDDLTLVAGAVP